MMLQALYRGGGLQNSMGGWRSSQGLGYGRYALLPVCPGRYLQNKKYLSFRAILPGDLAYVVSSPPIRTAYTETNTLSTR